MIEPFQLDELQRILTTLKELQNLQEMRGSNSIRSELQIRQLKLMIDVAVQSLSKVEIK